MRPFLLSLLISCSMVYSQNGNCKGGGTICLESSSFDAKDSIRVFFPTTFFSVDTSTRFILKMYNGDLNSDPNSELCNPNKNRVALVPLQQWTVPGNSPSILDGYSLGYTDVKINVQDPGILKALEVDPSFFFQISANVTGGSQCLLGPLTPFTHVSLVLSSVMPASSTSRTSSNLPSNTMSTSPSSGPLDLTKEAFIGIIIAIVLIFLALMAFLVFIILRKRKLGKKKFDTVQSTNIKKRVSFVPDNTVISTTSSIDILFPFAETSSSSSSNPPSPSILPPTENPFDDPVVQNHAHDSALLIAESYRQALNNPARAGPMKRELSSGSRKSQTFGELLKEI